MVIASLSWPNAAAVKKIEPTKNVTATVRGSACSKYSGNEPSAKHTEPTMKPTAIGRPLE